MSGLRERTPPGARALVKSGIRSFGSATAALRPPPDFLVVGTKRGGTTSMWNYLLAHPHVLPMVPATEHLKSPHYFTRHHDRGDAWYLSHFPTAAARGLASRQLGGPVVTGEASPYYLVDPTTPARVRALNPATKIVVLLRDPVARAYSHYWERVDQGVEPLGFAAALAAEDGRVAGEWERIVAEPNFYSRAHDWYSYRSRGEYAAQLRRWLAVFDRSQILVVASEDFFADAARIFSEVTDFLGVPRAPVPVERRHNHRPAPTLDPGLAAELAAYFQPYNAQLYELLGRDFGW